MRFAAAVAAAMALQSFTVIDHPELSAEIATQTARAIVQLQNTPAPKPVGGQCKNCNGTGKEPVSVLVKPKPCTTGKCPL